MMDNNSHLSNAQRTLLECEGEHPINGLGVDVEADFRVNEVLKVGVRPEPREFMIRLISHDHPSDFVLELRFPTVLEGHDTFSDHRGEGGEPLQPLQSCGNFDLVQQGKIYISVSINF